MSNQDYWREATDRIEAGSDGPRLLDVLVQIGLHDHICLIYESQEEQLARVSPENAVFRCNIRCKISHCRNL